MSEILGCIIYFVVVGAIFIIALSLRSKPKRHQWYEVGSSDIVNAERKKRKGK